jgi:hypothetical protein
VGILIKIAVRYFVFPLRSVMGSYLNHTYISKDIRVYAVGHGKFLFMQIEGIFKVETMLA